MCLKKTVKNTGKQNRLQNFEIPARSLSSIGLAESRPNDLLTNKNTISELIVRTSAEYGIIYKD